MLLLHDGLEDLIEISIPLQELRLIEQPQGFFSFDIVFSLWSTIFGARRKRSGNVEA